jgi:hypothetical protein
MIWWSCHTHPTWGLVGGETHSWRVEYLADPVNHVLDRVDYELQLLGLDGVANVLCRRLRE